LQALLWALSTTVLLVLSATATKGGAIPDGSYDHENSDVRNNLVEPHDENSVATSRNFREPYTSRPIQELAPIENSAGPPKKPQARTLSLPSFLGGEKEAEDNQATSAPTISDIAPLNDHPLWKVHKYQGIDLSPVLLPTAYGPPSEIYGPPAETYGPLTPSSPLESYGPPTDTFDLSESSGSATGDTSAALSALDNLSGLASILPEDGSTTSHSSSALSSLYSLPPQKSNSGLSLEQLSALATLVSFVQAKSNGQPSLQSNTPGTELSSLASLANLLPSETASSSGSLLTSLRSFLTRRPAFLTRLLKALNFFSPTEPKGAFPRFLKPNIVHLPPKMKNSDSFGSNYNTLSKLTENTAQRKTAPIGKIAKHIVIGKFPSKIGKLGKLGAIRGYLPFSLGTVLKGSAISNLEKLVKLGIIKTKLPLKVAIKNKPEIFKAVTNLRKLGTHDITKGHFPLKVQLLSKFAGLKSHDFSLFGTKSVPLKFAALASPLKLKKHYVSKLGKFGKIGIPLKLNVLGKFAALKGHLRSKLGKLVKLGIIKSYIPLKLLGKHAAIKSHFISKLIKVARGAKHAKYSILAIPIKAKKHIVSKLTNLGEGVKNIKNSLPSKFDILTLPLKLKIGLISKLKTGGKFSVIKHPDLKGDLISKPTGIKDIIELKTAKLGFPIFDKSDDASYAETSRKDDQTDKGDNIRGTVTYNVNQIPNFFLGTAPEAEVANVLNLPDLPPIPIPANYKFQETGVGLPYVVKYSKPASYGVRDNAYGSPSQEAVPTYEGPAQTQQEVSLYPPLHVASTYGAPIQPPPTFGPTQDASSFQPSQSLSQNAFDSFHSSVVSYPGSMPEPRSPTNSYGQPTAPYGAETDQTNSAFQTQFQNMFYSQAAQTSATGTPVSQSAYSVPQQNHVQLEVGGPSNEFGSYQGTESGSYAQQSYPSSHTGLYPGTSRSDTDIPSEDILSKQYSDFRPSTLAAATGAGYSRVAFQRSQQDASHDLELVSQPESKRDLVATTTSNVPRLNEDLQNADGSISHAILAATSEHSQLRKGN
jgi:hypothetical protein